MADPATQVAKTDARTRVRNITGLLVDVEPDVGAQETAPAAPAACSALRRRSRLPRMRRWDEHRSRFGGAAARRVCAAPASRLNASGMTEIDPVALTQALIRRPSVTPADARAMDVGEQ